MKKLDTNPNRQLLKAALRGINPLTSPSRFYEHSRIHFRPGQMWSNGLSPERTGWLGEVEKNQDPNLFYCWHSHEAEGKFDTGVEQYQGITREQVMELSRKYYCCRVELNCELRNYGQQTIWKKNGGINI